MQKNLGVALDIGTTTIQGKLIDLNGKNELAYFSCLNEQLTLGHDIVSRIKICLQKPDGLEKLNKKVISSINFVIENLLLAAKEETDSIKVIGAVGNAALYHFTLALSPKKLVEPPYQAEYSGLVEKKAKAMGIEAGTDCKFFFLPNIGSFIGSDAMAVILATGIDRSESPVLVADIGTNGEIIVGSKKRIWVTSTAAGPAFEGWHIKCGMRGVEGAVESIVDDNGKLTLKVIGGGEPMGISGSGLIDAIAIMLKRNYINSSGRVEKDFVIKEQDKRLFICQEDVREVQLAKAAFAVAISFLRKLVKSDISKFIITGNFGSYINKESAKSIGIIPKDIDLRRVEFLKNGALEGAEIFVTDRGHALSQIDDILNKTKHISLSQDRDFQKEFSDAIRF